MDKHMKKYLALLIGMLLIAGLTGCGNQGKSAAPTTQPPAESTQEPLGRPDETPAQEPAGEENGEPERAGGKILVVYFSATGNTAEAAQTIAAATGADLFALEPVEPYSAEDLNWTDPNSRVVYEHDNPDERAVELTELTVSNWEDYDTVFLGYPIWWQIAAWPVDGFVTGNDFTGKTVIPFATSASSGLGESGEMLAQAAGSGNWLEGMRFSSGASEAEVQAWVERLDLTE